MRVLIVEDEPEIVRFLKLELCHEGYETTECNDGKMGLYTALNERFDIILLDVMLPELSGTEVLRSLRKEKNTPVILVTARDSVNEKVAGLDMGANDYITKPFHIDELLARIRMVLRTAGAESRVNPDILGVCDIEVNAVFRTVTRGGVNIELTKTQYDLLEYLLRNKDIVLSREQILRHVWGYEYVGESNIVDVYVRYLRSRLHETEDCHIIETVRGVGYVIRDKTRKA